VSTHFAQVRRFAATIPGAMAKAIGSVALFVALIGGVQTVPDAASGGSHSDNRSQSQPVIIHVTAARKGDMGIYIGCTWDCCSGSDGESIQSDLRPGLCRPLP
jgi:hypothetical protein